MSLAESTITRGAVEEASKVLFIEDDQDDVFFIQRACQRAGVNESKCFLSDGKEAAQYLAGTKGSFRQMPKLIFLDLNMPMMSGFAFLDWLREQPDLENIPVIILTTSENPQDMRRAYEAGANAYLVKPTSIPQLAEMLGAAKGFWLSHNRSP